LTKNSAIASTIGVAELTYVGDHVGNDLALPLEALIGSAIGYLIITYPSGLLLGVLERRVAIKR